MESPADQPPDLTTDLTARVSTDPDTPAALQPSLAPIRWPHIPLGPLSAATRRELGPYVAQARQHGLPIHEICRQTGLPPTTIRKILDAEAKRNPIASIDSYRVIHLMRYEEIVADLIPMHKAGNLFATQQLLAVLSKIEKMLGLTAVQKLGVEVSGQVDHQHSIKPSQIVRDQLESMSERIAAMADRAGQLEAAEEAGQVGQSGADDDDDPTAIEGEVVDG